MNECPHIKTKKVESGVSNELSRSINTGWLLSCSPPPNLQSPSAEHLAGQPGKAFTVTQDQDFIHLNFHRMCNLFCLLVIVYHLIVQNTLFKSKTARKNKRLHFDISCVIVSGSICFNSWGWDGTCIHRPPSQFPPSLQEQSQQQLLCTPVLYPEDRNEQEIQD